MFETITIIPILIAIITFLSGLFVFFRAISIKRTFEDKEKDFKNQILKSIQERKRIEKNSEFRMKRLMELQNQYKEMEEREVLLKLIIECNNNAIRDEGNDGFKESMRKFADKLREAFRSEYCAIGMVSDGIAEDCIISLFKATDKKVLSQQEEYVQKVKSVSIDELQYNVCQALKENGRITYFDFDKGCFEKNEYCKAYEKHILNSHRISNTTIICIRDNNANNHGYIQFINSKRTIKFDDIKPFNDALLSLIDIIINSQKNQKEIQQKTDILDDFNFFRELQNNTDNVDDLLKRIMEYLSIEFHAGIISFRIPLLIGAEKQPLFVLRECYISEEIKKHEELRKHYFEKRFIREKEQMGGYDKFPCQIQESIIFRDVARDADYFDMISDENLQDKSFIIPVLRDVEEKEICIKTSERKKDCDFWDAKDCTDRFEEYYGVFKLRLFKNNKVDISNRKDNTDDYDSSKEIINRLSYLSEHISILLNYIINKTENASLKTFQKQLKNSSFTKIKEFDGQCVSIIRGIMHSKLCAIYRFDSKQEKLLFSAASDKKMQICNSTVSFEGSFDAIMNECGIPISNIDLDYMFRSSQPLFYLCDYNEVVQTIAHSRESVMVIPMIKKDNTRIGVILLIGKNNSNDVSNVFWEHDKKTMGFIINILMRIEESDSERLNFLSQLSHELLRPVTENVYSNDYIIDTAKRNYNSLTREVFLQEIRDNLDRNMLFKYIIEDVEYVYSLTKEDIQYKFEKCPHDEVKGLIIDTIELFQKEASFNKGLSFKTYLSALPTFLCVDKNRMMQVFINLIKNAIRYAEDDSEIIISYDYNRLEQFHEISFINRGIGVEESEKERIFDLFYRGENAKKKSVRGTGMGLFLVAEIMKAHEGRCIVKRLKNPTEFTLQLPRIK